MYHFRLWPERMKRFTDWATKAGLRSTTRMPAAGTGSDSAAERQKNKVCQRRPWNDAAGGAERRACQLFFGASWGWPVNGGGVGIQACVARRGVHSRGVLMTPIAEYRKASRQRKARNGMARQMSRIDHSGRPRRPYTSDLLLHRVRVVAYLP
jgi:hypothetical protein